VQRTYSVTIPSSAKVKLYISIIRLLFTHVAIPLIKDIKKLEQLHCRATKYILNDYVSNYKTRLMYLRILSSMYIFDILFLINNPTNNFNINNYISFSTSNTRTRGTKLRHNISSTNKEWHFYFNRISRLWNSILIIDLNLPVDTIKTHISGITLLQIFNQTAPINFTISVPVAPVHPTIS